MLPNSRQFHIPSSFIREDSVCIPLGNLYRQMVQVLRLQRSEQVRFFDGVGHVLHAHIAHINRDGILASINERSEQPRGRQVTLAIGILKNDRMRWVLEKATELGVTSIIPLLTERVVKRPDVSPPRWSFIVKEAAEQSGRAWLPTVAPVTEFAALMQRVDGNTIVYHTERAEGGAIPSNDAPITLVIGPEGGLTEEEVAAAQKKGATIASLGSHQLRADTAALAALVVAAKM
ncbi:MAG: RsmE family RNA methyltransferase [Patescibacteria group bacterium]